MKNYLYLGFVFLSVIFTTRASSWGAELPVITPKITQVYEAKGARVPKLGITGDWLIYEKMKVGLVVQSLRDSSKSTVIEDRSVVVKIATDPSGYVAVCSLMIQVPGYEMYSGKITVFSAQNPSARKTLFMPLTQNPKGEEPQELMTSCQGLSLQVEQGRVKVWNASMGDRALFLLDFGKADLQDPSVIVKKVPETFISGPQDVRVIGDKVFTLSCAMLTQCAPTIFNWRTNELYAGTFSGDGSTAIAPAYKSVSMFHDPLNRSVTYFAEDYEMLSEFPIDQPTERQERDHFVSVKYPVGMARHKGCLAVLGRGNEAKKTQFSIIQSRYPGEFHEVAITPTEGDPLLVGGVYGAMDSVNGDYYVGHHENGKVGVKRVSGLFQGVDCEPVDPALAPPPNSDAHAEPDLWIKDWDQAAREAQAMGKDVLVLISGSDWDPYSKLLSYRILSAPGFLETLAKDFVLLRLDLKRLNPLPDPQQQQLRDRIASLSIDSVPNWVFLSQSMQPYFASEPLVGRPLEQIENLKRIRDNGRAALALVAQAAFLQGLEKAKLLARALELIYQDEVAVYYRSWLRDLADSDGANQTGTLTRWLPIHVGLELRLSMQEATPEHFLRIIDEYSHNVILSPEFRQELLAGKVFYFLERGNEAERKQAIIIAREAYALAPHTQLGQVLKRMIDQSGG